MLKKEYRYIEGAVLHYKLFEITTLENNKYMVTGIETFILDNDIPRTFAVVYTFTHYRD